MQGALDLRGSHGAALGGGIRADARGGADACAARGTRADPWRRRDRRSGAGEAQR